MLKWEPEFLNSLYSYSYSVKINDNWIILKRIATDISGEYDWLVLYNGTCLEISSKEKDIKKLWELLEEQRTNIKKMINDLEKLY